MSQSLPTDVDLCNYENFPRFIL